MGSALELHGSRVDRVDLIDGVATVHFPHAYIHKSKGKPGRDAGSGWSQEAELILAQATVTGALTALPNTVAEGFLEVGGVALEPIPLPFKRKVRARLYLQFADGAAIEVLGDKPFLQLLGSASFLEDFS